MSNIFVNAKVPAGVISDEDDDLDAQVALYYDGDETPLFGDTSPAAVAMERMLQEGMMNGMHGAGAMYALNDRMQCDAFKTLEKANREIEKGLVRFNGPAIAGDFRTEGADEFWAPWVVMYEELLKVPGMFKTDARKKVAVQMAKEGAWLEYRSDSKSGRPGRTVLKEHLK